MNENTYGNKIIEKTALTLSAVFSPLLVPTYACALALWITPLSMVPEKVRFLISLIIFGITAAVPLAVIMFMIRAGKVADAAISNKEERDVPYLVTGACYVLAAIFLAVKHAPMWLWMFYAGAAFAVIVAVIINKSWKISAHATTMGGLCAMVFFIAINHLGIVKMLPWITVVMVLTGAVGSARLFLGRHTAGQVYAGFALGFVVEYVFMLL